MATAMICAASHPARTGDIAGSYTPPLSRPVGLQVLLILVVLSATVFSRFGINFGVYSLSFSLIATYALVAVALLSGSLVIATSRLLAYCACIVVAIASFLLNTSYSPVDRSSSTSLLLIAVIYFPLVFAIWTKENAEQQVLGTMRMFSNVALLCACAGIAQFYAQFFVGGDWLFDFTPYIPASLQAGGGVNTVIPMGYGGSVYKSNGFFFREPSNASFVMALGLLVELSLLRRPLRMTVFALALVLTYSGTGLVALVIGFMFSVRWRTIGRMCAFSAVAALCACAASDVLNLSFTFARINEFSSETSSGYQRYIAPMRLVSDMLFSQPWSFWFGLGPGTILRLSQGAYAFHDPTWAKLLVEYGALGFVAFLTLMLSCIRQRLLPLQLKAVLLFSWMVTGGNLLTPDSVYLVFVLTGLVGSASRLPPAVSASSPFADSISKQKGAPWISRR